MRGIFYKNDYPLFMFNFEFDFLIGVSHSVTTLKVNKQVLTL